MIEKNDYTEAEAIIHSGFIAQEVEQAANQTGYVFDGVHIPAYSNDNYSISYSSFVVPLVKGMQEQQAVIENQSKKIDEQAKEINSLKALNAEILKRLAKIEKSTK